METITTEYGKLDMQTQVDFRYEGLTTSHIMLPTRIEVDVYIALHGNEPGEKAKILIKDYGRETITEIPEAIYVGRSANDWVPMKSNPNDRFIEKLININAHWVAVSEGMTHTMMTDKEDIKKGKVNGNNDPSD